MLFNAKIVDIFWDMCAWNSSKNVQLLPLLELLLLLLDLLLLLLKQTLFPLLLELILLLLVLELLHLLLLLQIDLSPFHLVE